MIPIKKSTSCKLNLGRCHSVGQIFISPLFRDRDYKIPMRKPPYSGQQWRQIRDDFHRKSIFNACGVTDSALIGYKGSVIVETSMPTIVGPVSTT